MRIRRLDHIGVAVTDLEAAIPAYEALGLEPTSVEDVPSEQVRVALFPIGETRIELLAPATPEGVIARFLQKHGEGVHHIALEVEDVDAACEELEAAGVRLVYDTPHPGEGGARVNFVHPSSARGVLIELRQGP